MGSKKCVDDLLLMRCEIQTMLVCSHVEGVQKLLHEEIIWRDSTVMRVEGETSERLEFI